MVPTGALQYFSFYNFWVSPNDIKPSSGYGWNWTEISSWMNLPTVDPIALESDCWLEQWKQGTHSYIMCANCLPFYWKLDDSIFVDGGCLLAGGTSRVCSASHAPTSTVPRYP